MCNRMKKSANKPYFGNYLCVHISIRLVICRSISKTVVLIVLLKQPAMKMFKGASTLSRRNLKQVALFVRLAFFYTNTDVTKTKLSKTLFKPEEFENNAFRFRLDG